MTVWLAVAVVALALVVSAPYWLPGFVVGVRERIFARVNGDEGVPVPGRQVGVADFRRVYAHPAANGRSRGAALSDLFWYWLAPGPQVHQEHLEPGPRYDEAARATRQILARLRKDEWEDLVGRCAARVLDDWRPATAPGRRRRWTAVRLRDLMMPIWAEVYYEAVFGQPCPPEVRDLIVANADDVVSALKCTRLRHLGRRDRLTRYLRGRVDAGTVPVPLPSLFSPQEQAWYLQGTFFNTAVVQMSEAMAHLLMVVAERPDIQERLRAGDGGHLDRVIDETMRVYPLFGVAHRITSADITLDGLPTIPAGSVLLFHYAEYQHSGLPGGDHLDPDRWAHLAPGEANFIPFGVTANRPCPARGIAPLSLRVVAHAVIARFALATSAGHTRSLPNRGPCLLAGAPAGTSAGVPVGAPRPRARLAAMRVRDRWEDVSRSLVQLALGTYMVLDARRQRLCQTYFASLDHAGATPPGR
ncbi:cytochrome P450 [Rugosimonospora africana]|uniref:Cytochrome P450 n=1 Tax=Rugosimonospora africana TaxID=556532 RepID=A0A8J3R2K7_9ACTN|nr:cytochrome P450 [Rugosimonospora africana]GIH20372.1 cytochrome P450 [Rugosimonospora africana]